MRVVSDDGYADGEYEVEVGCSVIEPEEIADLDEKIRVRNAEKDDLRHQMARQIALGCSRYCSPNKIVND